MEEPIEMSHSAQLISEIDAAGMASLKQLAFWSNLHENTIRDYRDGRIKHFGAEMRFWNGVLIGLCNQHAPNIPTFVFRVTGLLLKGTPLSACHVPTTGPSSATTGSILRRFAPMAQSLGGAMEEAAKIYDDGRVTAADDPNICELETKIDQLINAAYQVKHRIYVERQKASVR